jgi:hypothetical protein
MTGDLVVADWAMPAAEAAPYLAGIEVNGSTMHALAHADVAEAVRTRGLPEMCRVSTVCGSVAYVVPSGSSFNARNPELVNERCTACAWIVAFATGDLESELARLEPSELDQIAIERFGLDPLALRHVCEAIVARTQGPRAEFEPGDEHVIALLRHVVAHAPVVVVPPECAEGECEHERNGSWTCVLYDGTVACEECSFQYGAYAGEYAGLMSGECTVPAPCGVLVTAGFVHGVTIRGGLELGRRPR